jgi:hypothetical protein
MQRTSTRLLRTDSDPFGQLRSALDTWRQSRKRGERIPEPLWKAAAGLVQTHGVGRVCVALKLNYYDLQRRLGGPRRSRNPRPASPTFVALPAPVLIDPGTFELTPIRTQLVVLKPTMPPQVIGRSTMVDLPTTGEWVGFYLLSVKSGLTASPYLGVSTASLKALLGLE